MHRAVLVRDLILDPGSLASLDEPGAELKIDVLPLTHEERKGGALYYHFDSHQLAHMFHFRSPISSRSDASWPTCRLLQLPSYTWL